MAGVSPDRWTCPEPDCGETVVVASTIQSEKSIQACIHTAQRVHGQRHAAARRQLLKARAR